MLVYVLGLLLSWRWLACACASVATVWLLLLMTVPESPRQLISNNNIREVIQVLSWLRSDRSAIASEIAEIQLSLEGNKGRNPLKDIWIAANCKPLALGLSIVTLEQLNGINAVQFYLQPILEEAHLGTTTLAILLPSGLQILATLCSSVFVDRLGRRPLLMISGTGMALSMLALGVYFYLKQFDKVANIDWLPVLSISVYLTSFPLGWGCITWTVLSEIFTQHVRSTACGICAMGYWLCAFLVTWQFENLSRSLGSYGVFWLFSALCFLGVIFVKLILLETKNKSLEELGVIFKPVGNRQ